MRRITLILLLMIPFSGCVELTEPPAPQIVIPPPVEGGCSNFCECNAEDVQGRVFRMTRLEIDEPDAFAEILNSMWSADIDNNILNVVFAVTEAVQGTSSAFRTLTIEAGPAWRDPKMPYVLPAEAGEPTSAAVDSYCLLEGMSEEINLGVYHGAQCELKNDVASSLYFHSGPMDAPIICAPDLEPANNIPISSLRIRTSLNRDCTGITDGFLEGCIVVDAADRICMCMAAGECPNEGTTGAEFSLDNLTGYCRDACGSGWTSFGQLVRTFGLLPTCLTEDGQSGYRVQGFFDAEEITDQFNPVSSGDCTVY